MRAFSHAARLFGCLVAVLVSRALAVPESAPAPAASVLTNAAQIRSLTPEQAGQKLPLCLRGVLIDAGGRVIVMADDTASIYVQAMDKLSFAFHQGDVVEVTGVTDPGGFAPFVMATAARKLAEAAVPPARAVSYQQLVTGALDAQWVELAGVVRHCEWPRRPNEICQMELAVDGGIVQVRFSQPRDPQIQEDAEVRVQAVCLYQHNRKRQVINPVLQVPRGMMVRVEKAAPAEPYAAPLRAAESLLLFSPENSYNHRIRVRGVVTHAQPGAQVWLRDRSGSLRLQTRQAERLEVGDEIDALGYPKFGAYSPVLEDAVFRKTGSTHPPVPLSLPDPAAALDHPDDLVALEAVLTELQPVLEGVALTLNRTGTVFQAVLRVAPEQRHLPEWQPGSQVRVAGICSVLQDHSVPVMGKWQPRSFQLLLRSPEDLRVLVPPSWWTPKHIILVLGAITGASLLVSALVMWLSRRRLQEQAQRRAMAEAEFAAIFAERNRVAREIHDTLAQGLVATTVQLRLARKHLNGGSEALKDCLETAQQLVLSSLEEVRSSIWNMRSQVLENGDLGSALEGILKQLAEGTELAARFEQSGRVRRLAPVIENNVLRIGQEAITNAIKHAQARHLALKLEFAEKELRLSVRDDGQGFSTAAPPPGKGGFGLVGMRERAAQLKGELQVRSAPGQGTELRLAVPIPASE